MAQMRNWEISDAFWALVEPLIPPSPRTGDKSYKRRPGGGRKPKYSNRLYFAAIVYVLRTGIIWKALPREKFAGLGPAAAHRKFQQWTQAEVFGKLWLHGLAEYEEMAGIAWHWQWANDPNIETPLFEESAVRNPADRGEKHQQTKLADQRTWRPFVTSRQRRPPA